MCKLRSAFCFLQIQLCSSLRFLDCFFCLVYFIYLLFKKKYIDRVVMKSRQEQGEDIIFTIYYFQCIRNGEKYSLLHLDCPTFKLILPINSYQYASLPPSGQEIV